MDIFWMILLQLALIGLNAIFACAEIAVLGVGETKLEKMAEDGNKKAAWLARLTKQPARFLATIQVAITLSGFLGSAFAAENFSGRIVDWVYDGLGFTALSRDTQSSVAVVLITLILSYLTLIFGELVPKRIAMRKAEPVAMGLSGILTVISKVFSPVVWLLTVSTNAILRICGIDPDQNDEDVSEEDIRIMVDAGTIDNDEKNFIRNVFEFDDLTAGEIATHRTEVTLLWAEDGDEEWEKTIVETSHAIYPVCEDTVDDILGVLVAKEYFRLASRDRETVMKNAVKPAYFVPEGAKADLLFRNMKKTRNRFAVVLDEHGGVAGILTINDLIEKLVGDFTDSEEESNELPEISKIDGDEWLVRGTAPVSDLEDALGISLDSESEDSDTFGGLALAALGMVPEDNATFSVRTEKLDIRDAVVQDHQVLTAVVSVISDGDETESEENSGSVAGSDAGSDVDTASGEAV